MKNIQGKMYLLGAFSLAGTSVVTGYILAVKLSSFTITTFSLGIMIVCLLPFYWEKTIRTIRVLKKNDWLMILFQSVFGIFLFRSFLLFGVNLTSTVEAGILTGTTPVVTSLMAFLFLKERFSGTTVLGIGFTVVGIILLQGINLLSAQFSTQHVLGNMLIICASTSESTFNIISRKHTARVHDKSTAQIHPMVQTLLVSAIAFILSIIPSLCEHPLASISLLAWKEWFALVWYGLIVTALAFVLFFEGVKHCNAYTTAAFSGMMPLTSMLLSLLLLKEKIEFTQWAGGFFIIFSMVLIGIRKAKVDVIS